MLKIDFGLKNKSQGNQHKNLAFVFNIMMLKYLTDFVKVLIVSFN